MIKSDVMSTFRLSDGESLDLRTLLSGPSLALTEVDKLWDVNRLILRSIIGGRSSCVTGSG